MVESLFSRLENRLLNISLLTCMSGENMSSERLSNRRKERWVHCHRSYYSSTVLVFLTERGAVEQRWSMGQSNSHASSNWLYVLSKREFYRLIERLGSTMCGRYVSSFVGSLVHESTPRLMTCLFSRYGWWLVTNIGIHCTFPNRHAVWLQDQGLLYNWEVTNHDECYGPWKSASTIRSKGSSSTIVGTYEFIFTISSHRCCNISVRYPSVSNK